MELPDFKEIVMTTHMDLIKFTIDRILFFRSDSILNDFIRMHIVDITPDKMLLSDKFFVYKGMWKSILEVLYKTYLPHKEYDFNWTIEATPYTLMLCDLTKDHFENDEIGIQKAILDISSEDIDNDLPSVLDNMGMETLGLENGLHNIIPENLIPKSNLEHLNLLFRLMNYPPLGDIALFIYRYNAHLKKQVTELSKAFGGIDPAEMQYFKLTEPLHYSYFYVDHKTIKKHGFENIGGAPDFTAYKSEIEAIRKVAHERKSEFKDNIICPCCGEEQEIELPEELLEYKLLIENRTLCKAIGLRYIEDFTEEYKNTLSERFMSFLPDINKVDKPDCLILVEGESEEISIPLLGFRKRFILSHNKIQVYNSKSKEKLAADFKNFKRNHPNLKMICLLDSDAVKERDEINRIIKEHKNKYRVVFINAGTFEDLFDLTTSVTILNEMYPDGEDILETDFDESKDFVTNIKKIMYVKKKAEFDKVAFASKISLKIDIEKLPKEIQGIFDIAESFTAPAKFIKR